MRDELNQGGAIVSNDRVHVTLGVTADYRCPQPEAVAKLLAIGGTVGAEPFRISLDRISGGLESVALRPSRTRAELGLLQRQLERRLAFHDLRHDGWSFNPHVTLLYRKGDPFLWPVPALEWMVSNVVLVHSLVGAGIHRELGRWPLVRRQMSWAF